MKRMIPIIALLLAPIMLLTACAMPGAATKAKNGTLAENKDYNAAAENEGTSEGKIWPWENPAITLPAFTGSVTPAGSIKSLKVLAIGDASSRDSLELLAKIAIEAGITDVKIAVLYKTGTNTSLAEQWSAFNFNRTNYTYYEDTGSGWQITEKVAPKDILQSEKWDYVILQQNIALSGDAQSIDNTATKALSNLLTAIDFPLRSTSSSNKNVNKNPNAKIMWLQVWAYENNSRNNLFNSFKNYDNDQIKMYSKGIEAILSQVITQKKLNGVIPVGTAIQNMRNAYWSDGLTKDAEYLSTTGKVAAAVAVFKSLTGYDINGMELNDPAFDHARPHMIVIKESANNAYLSPYEITPSVFNGADE